MNGLRRDQKRAADAYRCVREAREHETNKKLKDFCKKYKIAIDTLGPAILQNGLVAAFAFLERNLKDEPILWLLNDLAKADIPGLAAPGETLPEQVRNLDADEYMLATRELLAVVHWFKRACQALIQD